MNSRQKMQKVQRSDITTQPQFSFAHEYLKTQVMKIATEFSGKPDSDDVNEKANNHFKMVAKIVKTYMTIIESFHRKLILKIYLVRKTIWKFLIDF